VGPRKGPKKILIVDDDPLVLRILKDKLAQDGFLVTTTSSAFGAVQLIQEQSPDIVIIDVMLPALPGNRIAALVKEQMEGRTKVLLYSAKQEAELKELAAECGADAWLVKSDDYGEVVTAARRLGGVK
jgi:DNA-binding response OmpR family regulator